MDLFGLVGGLFLGLVFLVPLGGLILSWLVYAYFGNPPRKVRNVGNSLLVALLLIIVIPIVVLISHANAFKRNQMALCKAALVGDTAHMERLIQSGADVDYWGEDMPDSPLVNAASGGHIEAVKTLLRHHANPNGGGRVSPLDIAKEEKHSDIVQLLKAAGAKE